ncbi:polysaccharide deacetylase family protein [Acidaminococcus timonensis]|uniref:hypothetical protein n=1 Tax=Acidaminococcus timonensis TaxID=1871002 RepID=UPI0008D98A1C|nr:hypothetical protein [Acidaminococcus timonensis]
MLKKTMLAALAFCLSLSVPAFAKVESEQARIADLEMTWPVVETKNKKADGLINKDIKSFMDDFRAGFVDRKFTSGRTWYETKYEDNQLVSLVLSDLRSEGNENKVRTRGVVYELDTGSRLPLSAFVRVTVADLNGYLASQCYNSSDVKIHPDKQVTRVPEDFFLNPDGSISILFQTSEVGGLLDGPVYIRLSQSDLRELNARNPRA